MGLSVDFFVDFVGRGGGVITNRRSSMIGSGPELTSCGVTVIVVESPVVVLCNFAGKAFGGLFFAGLARVGLTIFGERSLTAVFAGALSFFATTLVAGVFNFSELLVAGLLVAGIFVAGTACFTGTTFFAGAVFLAGEEDFLGGTTFLEGTAFFTDAFTEFSFFVRTGVAFFEALLFFAVVDFGAADLAAAEGATFFAGFLFAGLVGVCVGFGARLLALAATFLVTT